MTELDKTLAIIMAGGQGTRLYPLTQHRSKPAVPYAGRYRLIDFPLSNCINSGISRIGVLTQYNSTSLHRHISQTYHFDGFRHGWVELWSAEQTMFNTDWYLGTADAVRKQLVQIKATHADYVLILSGDHLYRMDYAEMLRFHLLNGAEVTIAVRPVEAEDTHRFGILKVNDQNRITRFAEKPKDPQLRAEMANRTNSAKPFLASMGIYLFNIQALGDLLEGASRPDFGSDVIPGAIQTHQVYGFHFEKYWEDIGTIASYYETNLALTSPTPPFNFYEEDSPIYTHSSHLPCPSVEDSYLYHVLLGEGCRIRKSTICRSVIGLRSRIMSGTHIENSIIVGADHYEDDSPDGTARNGSIPLGIGHDVYIEGAIIDENARIGDGAVIRSFPRGVCLEKENWVIQNGIVVVRQGAVIPSGTHIEPFETSSRSANFQKNGWVEKDLVALPSVPYGSAMK